MDKIFFQWLKINGLLFAGAFMMTSLVMLLFPDALLAFGRRWSAYTIAVAPTVLDPIEKKGLFVNILIFNVWGTLIRFLASLFFLAPLIAVISGVFYSIGLISAIERDVEPVWHSPVLIVIEVLTILLTITVASALATEIFDVQPARKDYIDFWRKNLKTLFPERERSFKEVFNENKKELAVFVVVIFVLLVLGVWIELYPI